MDKEKHNKNNLQIGFYSQVPDTSIDIEKEANTSRAKLEPVIVMD